MNSPSMTDRYHIRTLQPGEIETAVDWAAAEGWNPGVHDAKCFQSADPQGFLGGFIGDELIATISAVKYGRTFGFIGFYIVKAEYRGHGYGLKLWNAALASLGNRLVGLDGVFAQQENYQKSGFGLAYSNVRYQSVSQTYNKPDNAIVHLSEIPLQSLLNTTGSIFQKNGQHF
jgi:ribosomal protein S18 acetylase RimI-like enzyme